MKNLFLIICVILSFSCNSEKEAKGAFTVFGQINNAPDQNIFLEEIYFDNRPPAIIDTSKLKSGRFSVKGISPQQGLYRLRLEKGNGFIFINDAEKISVTLDATAQNLSDIDFKTPANQSLIRFLLGLDARQKKLTEAGEALSSGKTLNSADTGGQPTQQSMQALQNEYRNYILHYVDTTASPVMALFALGYTQEMEPAQVDKAIEGAGKRFPSHLALNEIINQYKLRQAQESAQSPAPLQNIMAPEINLPDTQGKLFSLSSLKGKYVLVDFWASWCGPCRMENPNVVAAYNKFKSNNFTILGVSLDREKEAWMKAIQEDGLTWTHVSDLKFWNSAVVPLYNIEGIPYNVLVDPAGKIVASNLRGNDLENNLSRYLKN